MTTAREQYLLRRCLRLEARLAGLEIEDEAVPAFAHPKRTYSKITPALIEEMRALHAQGMTPYRIALRLGCSHTTVRRYTR